MLETICAVIVTYNRKQLLKECITAILNQSVKPTKILIIDNASTDGTIEMISQCFGDIPDILVMKMKENLGGAGGFYEGIKYVKEYDFDWAWIMDDDSIPKEDCLEKLITANASFVNSHNSFYASLVYGKCGEPMNVPEVDIRCATNGYRDWQYYLNKGLVKISTATFVSLFISTKAIKKVGLPCKGFFIWGDDSEYTRRLTTFYGPAYLVGASIVVHKRANANAIDLNRETNKNRIRLYHYQYRNDYIYKKYYKLKSLMTLRAICKILIGIKLLGKENGVLKFRSYEKGLIEGLIQYKHFSNYIDEQISTGNKEFQE